MDTTLNLRLTFIDQSPLCLQRACNVKVKPFPFLLSNGTVPMRMKETIYLLFLRDFLTYVAHAFWYMFSATNEWFG